MTDSRIREYAHLLVDRCVNVQPGWQVMVLSTPLARPLIEEVIRRIAQRGAYAVPRINFPSFRSIWAKEAPDALLENMPPLELHAQMNVDAMIFITAPENTRDGSDIPPQRLNLLRKAERQVLNRRTSLAVPWVNSQFPTPALAQEAGMTLPDFEDFLFGACLIDWDAETQNMQRIAERFDRAEKVRIGGIGTDLTFSLAGRKGYVDGLGTNLPGGEVFYCPLEDSVEGVVHFAEFPTVYGGHQVEGARLVFRNGRVVEASATAGESFLLSMLKADEGAGVIGEFGIGCNPAIQRFMRNTLFDEKIFGTIHLALGAGFPFIGGTNVSNIHWDMVKDLRQGGRIYCDGELVQENGRWVF